jgi:hypothetical protein
MSKKIKGFKWEDTNKIYLKRKSMCCRSNEERMEAFAIHKAISKKMRQVEKMKEWLMNVGLTNVDEVSKQIDAIFREVE